MAALRKVGNAKWGLGNRVLTTTVHALIESIINCGLSLTGSPATVEDIERVDTAILNPIARRVAGVGYSIRHEVLYSLADLRTTKNHYLLKVANATDRIPRTRSTQAQAYLQKYLETQGINGQPWIAPQKCRRFAGQEWKPEEVGQRWMMTCHRGRRGPRMQKDETKWWSPETRGRQDKSARGEGCSKYISHAEALRNMPTTKTLAFQFAGLKDWRQVALRVLTSIRWDQDVCMKIHYTQTAIERTKSDWGK